MDFETDFGKSLDEAFDRISSDDAGKWDATVATGDICLYGGLVRFPQALADGHDGGLAFSPWAQSQVCQKLGIPSAYFRKCPPALQDAQFNYWARQIQDEESHLLLRSKGATVRGLLSRRYVRLDNRDVLTALRPLVVGQPYRVGLCEVGPESLHLRLVNPGLFRDVLPGDRLMAGIHIANSEVGLRSVTVEALVFRLVCMNGLVHRVDGRTLLRQRHVSLAPARFRERLSDALAESLAAAAGFLEHIQAATRTRVIEPYRAVSLIAQAWDLPEATEELIRSALHRENAAGSLYGLANGITSAAQRLPMEERYALEVRTGSLLDPDGPEQILRQRLMGDGAGDLGEMKRGREDGHDAGRVAA